MANKDGANPGEQGQDQGQRAGHFRSGPSRIRSFIRFVNWTERSVDVIWLNYEGLGVRYRSLAPSQSIDVNTFVGHPWIFRDSETGDRLCVQLREVYEPVGWNTEQGPPRRRQVYITNQLYSLRDRCLQVVRRLVRPQNIPQLELPREISCDLLSPRNDVPVDSLYDQAARSIVTINGRSSGTNNNTANNNNQEQTGANPANGDQVHVEPSQSDAANTGNQLQTVNSLALSADNQAQSTSNLSGTSTENNQVQCTVSSSSPADNQAQLGACSLSITHNRARATGPCSSDNQLQLRATGTPCSVFAADSSFLPHQTQSRPENSPRPAGSVRHMTNIANQSNAQLVNMENNNVADNNNSDLSFDRNCSNNNSADVANQNTSNNENRQMTNPSSSTNTGVRIINQSGPHNVSVPRASGQVQQQVVSSHDTVYAQRLSRLHREFIPGEVQSTSMTSTRHTSNEETGLASGSGNDLFQTRNVEESRTGSSLNAINNGSLSGRSNPNSSKNRVEMQSETSKMVDDARDCNATCSQSDSGSEARPSSSYDLSDDGNNSMQVMGASNNLANDAKCNSKSTHVNCSTTCTNELKGTECIELRHGVEQVDSCERDMVNGTAVSSNSCDVDHDSKMGIYLYKGKKKNENSQNTGTSSVTQQADSTSDRDISAQNGACSSGGLISDSNSANGTMDCSQSNSTKTDDSVAEERDIFVNEQNDEKSPDVVNTSSGSEPDTVNMRKHGQTSNSESDVTKSCLPFKKRCRLT